MSDSGRLVLGALPEPVLQTLEQFEAAFGAVIRLVVAADDAGGAEEVLYQSVGEVRGGAPSIVTTVVPHLGPELQLHVLSARNAPVEAVSVALTPALSQGFEATREIQFFTYELSERFEEINLLYSISETLGSTLDMDSDASMILDEVRENARQRNLGLWTMLTNQLSGLYDGYLYGNIFQLAEKEQLPEATVAKIKGIVERIERHIEITGQTETIIF